MDEHDTWIEPPVYQQPQTPPSEPPLPPLPPPPPPPGSGGKNWLVIGAIMGVVIIVLCGVAGYVVWQMFAGDGTDLSDGSEAAVFQTQTALAQDITNILLLTDTPSPEPTLALDPTEPAPIETLEPTEIPTDTLAPTSAIPVFTASQAIFCRSGPSSIYPEVRTMDGGVSLPILGQSTSPVDGVSIWWQVEIESRKCFVSSSFGTVQGDTSGVPVLAAPPTPTPTPTLTPTATPTATATP